MSTGLDLSSIYELRKNFTVIGITGRTGSGCTTVSKQLEKGFKKKEYQSYKNFSSKHNSYRKYRIIYNYAEENFKPFKLIRYVDVLTLFILAKEFEELISYLQSSEYMEEFNKSGLSILPDYEVEILKIRELELEFIKFKDDFKEFDFKNLKKDDDLKKLTEQFNSIEFKEFSSNLLSCLETKSIVKRNKFLQILANNLRRSGEPYDASSEICPPCIFTISELINDIIKGFRRTDKDDGEREGTKIIIDSLRNPMEIMFFKQRFSAFYLVAINREAEAREENLKKRFKGDLIDILKILNEEHEGGKGGEFYRQYVKDCIQKADIHITYRTDQEAEDKNREIVKGDNTSPYYSWKMQLLKYVSLIDQPGLVTPSPEERCMQMAYTAKYNSGCISRQVGATITDEFYSIKAVGWNNTPEGQVPCSLRNAEDLLNDKNDIEAFTPYERNEKEFQEVLKENFEEQINRNRKNLGGRNVCFCFKSLKNSYSEGKNQVHTRSLHAEESAFLQIAKYGGNGVKKGKLFTTASPCELCSKKSYQLGINVIYYIDPYPGISRKQILEGGTVDRNPKVRLFNGAIGNAYHLLYEPFMAYKDELALILGNPIKDKVTKLEDELKTAYETIDRLKKKPQI